MGCSLERAALSQCQTGGEHRSSCTNRINTNDRYSNSHTDKTANRNAASNQTANFETDKNSDANTVTVTIGRLRRNLGDPPVITTTPTVGYRIADPSAG